MSQQRSFNFYSVPAANNKATTTTSQSTTNNNSSSNQQQNNNKSNNNNQKRPLSGKTNESEPVTKTNQQKISKFFVQKPESTNNSSPSTSSSSGSKLPSSTVKRTRVVKMQRKDGKIVQDCEVYIGRAVTKGGWNLPHSKWGNPYPVSTCGGSAEVACQKYRDYVLRRDDLLKDLDELDGKVLGCWCKVDSSCHCHGDTLVELLEMKHNGELDEYIKNYLAKYPEPLYPISNTRGKKQ